MPLESAEAEVREEARLAIREIASEFARFFATTGIAVYEFDHAFRSELIGTLSDHLRREGREPTVARLAVLSGLPRSCVEQAIAQREALVEPPRTEFGERGFVMGLATMASLWTSDPRFTAVYGVPRDLTIRTATDSNASLEDLARLALPAVAFDRVLELLNEHGLIEIDLQSSIARLKNQTVFLRNLDAQVISHYGRMVSGLMRNLRVNRELRHEAPETKPWNCALIIDRPIHDGHLPSFLETVAEGGSRWFRTLELVEGNYRARAGEEGRRFAVCAFVATDTGEPVSALAVSERDLLAAGRLYQRALVTTNCLDARSAAEFREQVAHTGQAWLASVDAEHTSYLAAPGQPGTRLVVCCYLFDVTGSAETAEQAIDVLNARATRLSKSARRMSSRG
jgi:hypothetical protein